MCHPESTIFTVLETLQRTLVFVIVLPLARQRVTLHFTSIVQPQGRITRPRTPSSGNGHARHSAAKKWRHRPRVRGFTGTLSKVCFRYLQDRSAARTVVAQPTLFHRQHT